jgi:hypothetical protein
MRPNLPFVSAKHTLVTYNIMLSLITKTNQGPRCFHAPRSRTPSPKVRPPARGFLRSRANARSATRFMAASTRITFFSVRRLLIGYADVSRWVGEIFAGGVEGLEFCYPFVYLVGFTLIWSSGGEVPTIRLQMSGWARMPFYFYPLPGP